MFLNSFTVSRLYKLFIFKTIHKSTSPGIQLVSTLALPAHSKVITLTTPTPACLYTPSPLEADADGSTVVLKWNALGSNGYVTTYPITFVVESREKKENDQQKDWTVLGYVSFPNKTHPHNNNFDIIVHCEYS